VNEVFSVLGTTLIPVLSPELQECMDQTKGALLQALTAGRPQNPQSLRAPGAH